MKEAKLLVFKEELADRRRARDNMIKRGGDNTCTWFGFVGYCGNR